MLAEAEKILRLIPQRPPMVMVDKLLSCDESSCTTTLKLRKDNLFVSQGEFLEPGLIENMAQTAAIRTGWLASGRDEGDKTHIPIGVIGAVKNFKLSSLPRLGDELTTTIKVLFEFGDASVIQANILSGNKAVAECEMKIFLTNEL